jgi:hypothetical protein
MDIGRQIGNGLSPVIDRLDVDDEEVVESGGPERVGQIGRKV